MAFDLEIVISGLCLLARDETDKRLHVLMPTSGASVHLACLGHARKYVGQPAGKPIFHKLDKWALDLTALTSTNGLDLTLPAEVFDHGGQPAGNRSVNRSMVGNTLPAEVYSRVSLAAGRCEKSNRGGAWYYRSPDGTERTYWMATEILWLLKDVPGTELPLNLGPAGNITLKPVQQRIRFMVLHLMPGELGGITTDTLPGPTTIPPNRRKPAHFDYFYKLLTPATPRTLPEFDRNTHDQRGGSGLALAAAGGSELTCMLTTAPVRP